MSGDVVDLADRRNDSDVLVLQATCANPRCDEQFERELGPGRRKDFHNEECRRRAEQDRRRLMSRLEHYERQAEQMRAAIAAYVRTSSDEGHDAPSAARASAADVQRAREAIAEVRGMTRFLRGHQDEFALELLKLFDAVEPLVSASRT